MAAARGAERCVRRSAWLQSRGVAQPALDLRYAAELQHCRDPLRPRRAVRRLLGGAALPRLAARAYRPLRPRPGGAALMSEDDVGRPRSWLGFLLLWWAGVDLRLTILAVPPVLPLIHRDLALDEKSVAALTGLPVLLFGLLAIPGSLLIARLGARRAA